MDRARLGLPSPRQITACEYSPKNRPHDGANPVYSTEGPHVEGQLLGRQSTTGDDDHPARQSRCPGASNGPANDKGRRARSDGTEHGAELEDEQRGEEDNLHRKLGVEAAENHLERA